ncbi:Zinc finger BED domain-containing protein DAYSLEEPER [Sesamum angolense]|uniref:Zinc finger BED domain-containing protein DAYSLEEPER n=1 Tax=Sesamum angolense TaxID=2727404 RepID=A0AAE1VW50_9LAMI|nr:Zinc finger BED domain-containing protein DAYSLEEPER [Sesamum angolense]
MPQLSSKLDDAATLLKARRHSSSIIVKARRSSARCRSPQNSRSSPSISFARRRLTRFSYVPAPHTVEVLADALVETLMDWNIDRKVSTITIDNCTTNDAMINHLLQKLPTKDMSFDGKVLHMRYCAHILNLIVKDGLDIIDHQSRCCTFNENSSSIGGLENTMSSDVHSNVNVDESLDEFEQYVVSKTSGATNLSATSELDMYLEESLLPRARDFDILNWWKTNGVKFPIL